MQSFDVVIVGAGMSGLCMIHKARELGFSAIALEAGEGVGGAWYWNRYPGCRCDVPSIEYSFSFSKEVEQEWNWSEAMASQPEIERYLNFVADRLDLRKDIRFNQYVESAQYNDETGTWQVATGKGDRYEGKFLVMASGGLSVPLYPSLPNAEAFKGQVIHTAEWPNEPIDFSDKRVGVIGTGSSGVQLTQTIAPQALSLTSFQRTPGYTFPANNHSLSEAYMQEVKDNYDEIREKQRNSIDGLSHYMPMFGRETGRMPSRKLKDLTPEQRQQEIEEFGITALMAYADLFFDEEADKIAQELFREYLHGVVKDPAKAEALMPKNQALRCKRTVLDTNYYDVYNLPNVDVVSLREDPIVELTETGVTNEKTGHHEFDILIYATGFDAGTGPLTRIDIRNAEGKSIKEVWEEQGTQTYLGLQISGFPNLFTVANIDSPSVLSNLAFSIEYHVNWIGDCLDFMRSNNLKSIEATQTAQSEWGETLNKAVEGRIMVSSSCNSWYLGSNVEGKARRFLVYAGGCVRYDEYCRQATENNYQMFLTK
jgi:cyclohexanone monooxygenase